MAFKLDIQHKHILNIVARDKKDDGWTTVSEKLFPVLSHSMPPELIIFEKREVGGVARLTAEGENILSSMAWL